MQVKKDIKNILGIIGLRSGSTGLKNKNIKKLNNKPLFSYIYEAAKKSKYINRIIFSTDSDRYIQILKKYGIQEKNIIKRPKSIAKKKSLEFKFIKHAVDILKKKEEYIPDIIVRLLATCPLQKTKDIDKCINLIKNKSYNSAIIISKSKQSPFKAIQITGNKKKFLKPLIGSNPVLLGKGQNRQDYPETYFRANVLAGNYFTFQRYKSLSDKKPGYIITKFNPDIDDKIDFKIAELLIKNKI